MEFSDIFKLAKGVCSETRFTQFKVCKRIPKFKRRIAQKTVQVSNFENRSEPLAAITTTPGTVPELPTHCPLT